MRFSSSFDAFSPKVITEKMQSYQMPVAFLSFMGQHSDSYKVEQDIKYELEAPPFTNFPIHNKQHDTKIKPSIFK